MSSTYSIRDATVDDVATLVAFTLREAAEAEGFGADAAAVERGVRRAFEEPRVVRYWIAEDESGAIAGSTSVVTEWSDFRGGEYWWVQSLFVAPEHRGRGLVDQLLDHVATVGRAAGAIDVRLYVHESNERAIRAYRRAGFELAPYRIMRRELA
jgi:ribosomal protein S18 acetylase RimI-like enzyme